jgi:hypothetical protein
MGWGLDIAIFSFLSGNFLVVLLRGSGRDTALPFLRPKTQRPREFHLWAKFSSLPEI